MESTFWLVVALRVAPHIGRTFYPGLTPEPSSRVFGTLFCGEDDVNIGEAIIVLAARADKDENILASEEKAAYMKKDLTK